MLVGYVLANFLVILGFCKKLGCLGKLIFSEWVMGERHVSQVLLGESGRVRVWTFAHIWVNAFGRVSVSAILNRAEASGVSCSTSPPGGNQVDGLPPAAVEARRCTVQE